MAGSEGTVFSAPANYNEIDRNISLILDKCDESAQGDIIQQLEQEFDKKFLLDNRNLLFENAKIQFEHILKESGMMNEGDSTNIETVNRSLRNSATNIAKDMVDIHLFLAGKTTVFPRNTLSESVKFIEVLPADRVTFGSQDIPVINIAELAEVSNLVNDLKNRVESLETTRAEDRARIIALEQELVQVRGQINLFHTAPRESIETQTGQTGQNVDVDVEMEDIMSGLGANNMDNTDGNTEGHGSVETVQNLAVNPDTSSNPPSSGGQSNISVNPDTSSNPPSNGGGQSNISHNTNQTSDGSQPVRMTAHRNLNSTSTNQNIESIRRPLLDNNRSRIYHIPNNNGGHTTIFDKRPRQLRPLLGNPQERGAMFYIENISVDDENDKAIGNSIKEYCRNKGIRVMSYKIIRNKFCFDTVGCKVTVPESQEYIVLDPLSWPQNIKCRRWKTKEEYFREKESFRWSSAWNYHENESENRNSRLYEDQNDNEYRNDRYYER